MSKAAANMPDGADKDMLCHVSLVGSTGLTNSHACLCRLRSAHKFNISDGDDRQLLQCMQPLSSELRLLLMETENPGFSAFECTYRMQRDLMRLRITRPR